MSEYEDILTFHLEKFPQLRAHLEKICLRWNKRGSLTGRIKLGRGLDYTGEQNPLAALFGERAITVTKNDEFILSLDRYFQFWDKNDKEKWIQSLFDVLGIRKVDNKAESKKNSDEISRILSRLKLRFPQLQSVHAYLGMRNSYWQKQLSILGPRHLQNLLTTGVSVTEVLLANKSHFTLATLGANFCNDSKAFRKGKLYSLVGDMLATSLNEPTLSSEVRERVYQQCGIVKNLSAIKVTVFGPLCYDKKGQRFDWIQQLWNGGETATLSLDNLNGIENIEFASGQTVSLITCENESPFYDLVRERHPGTIVYTDGYPNSAVKELVRFLSPKLTKIHHWGDTDPDGLIIASQFAKIRPVELWRCSLADARRLEDKLKELTPEKIAKAKDILLKETNFPFRNELRYTLKNGWLEQENWEDL